MPGTFRPLRQNSACWIFGLTVPPDGMYSERASLQYVVGEAGSAPPRDPGQPG